jgi:hypothetical protein
VAAATVGTEDGQMATSIFDSVWLRAAAAVLCLGMAACATGNERGPGGGGGDDDDSNGSGSNDPERWGGILPTVEACVYPTSGYGATVGSIAPLKSWQGFLEGSDVEGELSIENLYDCHGTRGINGILLIGSSMTCGVCMQEAGQLEAHTGPGGDFETNGIKVATLMMAGNTGGPASTSDANAWKTQYGLETSAVVADPGFTFAVGQSVGTPLHVVIDPRTMQIVDRVEGWTGEYSKLLQLAQQNQAQ